MGVIPKDEHNYNQLPSKCQTNFKLVATNVTDCYSRATASAADPEWMRRAFVRLKKRPHLVDGGIGVATAALSVQTCHFEVFVFVVGVVKVEDFCLRKNVDKTSALFVETPSFWTNNLMSKCSQPPPPSLDYCR